LTKAGAVLSKICLPYPKKHIITKIAPHS